MQVQVKCFDRIAICHFSEKVTKEELVGFEDAVTANSKSISQLILILDQAILDAEMAKTFIEMQQRFSKVKLQCFFVSKRHPFANTGELSEVLDYIGNATTERIVDLMSKELELEEQKKKIDSLYKKASTTLQQALGVDSSKPFSPDDFKSLSSKLVELNKKLEHQYKVYHLEVERLLLQMGEDSKQKTIDPKTQDRLKAIKQKGLTALKEVSK